MKQIVVISGENVIEEGVIIEQESEQHQLIQAAQLAQLNQSAQQRTRKQQLETITDIDQGGSINDHVVEKVSATVPATKRQKVVEEAPQPNNQAPAKPTRATRAAAAAIVQEAGKDEEDGVEEDGEENDVDDGKQAKGSPVKRTRGRPPRGEVARPIAAVATPAVTPTITAGDDSPQRKSARIARK